MPESGGPAAQSGFYYQNTIAALYLGRLLDPRDSIDARRVISVRCEAPEVVDDIVVEYADGAHEYIQAKERLGEGKRIGELWERLHKQYSSGTFRPGRDRLVVYTADSEAYALAEAAKRARGAESASEWERALNASQRERVEAVAVSLGLELPEVRPFFSALTIEIASVELLEGHRLDDWIPHSNRTREELFQLLRDRVGGHARFRIRINALDLRTSLAVESPSLVVYPSPVMRRREPFETPPAELIGREAELEHLTALIEGAPAHGAAIHWILGEAGSGKSALAATLARGLESSGQLLTYYSFGEAAGRSTGAFVAALEARMGEPAVSDDPMVAARAALRKAGLSGSRRVIIIDAVDELLPYEPHFLDDLDRLAARGIVWIATSRPLVAVRARIDAGSPHAAAFASGLPRLSPGAVRILGQAWSGVADPGFLESLVSSAQGLPLYVRCVAEEVRSGVRSPYDTDLPVSLSDFYARAIRQLKSREDGALAAGVVAIAGQALEPVTPREIAVILAMSARSPEPADDVCHRVEDAATRVAGVLVAGPDGAYAPCHASVRDYLNEVPGPEWREGRDPSLPADPIAARRALAATAGWWRTMLPGRLRDHMFRFGSRYALYCGDAELLRRAAERVTSFDYWMERLRDAQTLDAIAAAREIESVCIGTEAGIGMEWSRFFRQRAHVLSRALPEWPAHKLLLQVAAEAPAGSIVRHAADEWLEAGGCDWLWLRSTDASASVDRPVPRWVAEAHDGSVSNVMVTADGRLYSWGTDQRLRVWEVEEGQPGEQSFWNEGEIRSACITDDGALAFVVGPESGGHAALWDGRSPMRVLRDFEVTGLVCTRGGVLVAWSDEGVFTLDAATFAIVEQYDGYASRTVGVMTGDTVFAVFSAEGSVEVFSVAADTGALTFLEEHPFDLDEDIDELRVAPRRLLAWASRFGRRVFLLDTETWELLASPSGNVAGFLPDETAVISDAYSLSLVSLENGRVLRASPRHAEVQPQMLVFPSGKVMTWSRKTFRVWSVADLSAPLHESPLPHTNYGIHVVGEGAASETTLEGLRIVSAEPPYIAGVLPAVGDMVLGAMQAGPSAIAVWARNGTLCVWDHSSVTATLQESNRCRDAEVLGRNRIVGLMGDRVELIDGESGAVLSTLPHADYPMGCCEVDDSRAATWTHQNLFLWTAEDGRLNGRRIGAVENNFEAVEALPDGSIVTATSDRVQVWPQSSGAKSYFDFPLRSAEGERLSWIVDKSTSTALFFETISDGFLMENRFIQLPGARLATVASTGGAVTLYCALSREALAQVDGNDCGIFRLRSDRTFATCDRTHVWLWDAAVFRRDPASFPHERVRLVLAPSEQLLVTASDEATYVWDVKTHSCVRVPLASWDVARCYDAGEGRCIIVPADGPLQCWSVAVGEQIWTGSARELFSHHSDWALAIAHASRLGVPLYSLGRMIAFPARESRGGFAVWHGGSEIWIAGLTASGSIAVAQERGRASVLQPYHGGRHLSREEFFRWCEPGLEMQAPVYGRAVFVQTGDPGAALCHKLGLAGYETRKVTLEGKSFDDYRSQVDAVFDRAAWSHPDQPLILIGHGLGALVAAEAAIRHRDVVQGLALVEPFLSTPVVSWREWRWARELRNIQQKLFAASELGIPLLTLAAEADSDARWLHQRLSGGRNGDLAVIEGDDLLLTGLRSREVDDRILTWLAPWTGRAPANPPW